MSKNFSLSRQLAQALLLVAGVAACQAHAAKAVSNAAAQPKLVVVLVVDGLPQEQVTRYREQFGQGGFRRLLEQGAWFSDAHQAHGITVTAIGHSAVLSGAYPYQHGVIGNNWIDPVTKKSVYCTEDGNFHYIGEATQSDDGTAPTRLRVSTLGDELRYATGDQAKVVTVSGKDRGAILLAGKTGTAYMYMEKTGNFASSTYYMQQHPQWVQRYQTAKPQDRYYGKSWTPLLADSAYVNDAREDIVPAKPGTRNTFPFAYYSDSGKLDGEYYSRLKSGPFLDELTLEFARAAVDGENLGRNPAGVPDILGVSLSAHDYVNHAYGPESRMSHDHLQRLDRMLAGFFADLDKKVGMDNVLVVLTADHGFANVPEFAETRGFSAKRIDGAKLVDGLNQHLATTLGIDKLVTTSSLPNIYLDYALAEKRGVHRAALEDAAARFLLQQDGLAQVYTRTQMETGAVATRMDTLMRRAWNRQLSGDLMVVTKPAWYFGKGAGGTSHGTPYTYDTNVPLMVFGPRWIKPGAYGQYAEVVDIAPTLAHLLRIRQPSASEGRVLTEVVR